MFIRKRKLISCGPFISEEMVVSGNWVCREESAAGQKETVRTKTDMTKAMPNQGGIFSHEFWNEHMPKKLADGLSVDTGHTIWES